VSLGLLGLAGLLLSVERVCYAWIARAPASFRDWCARPLVGWLGESVVVVRALFVAFKALQYTVFAGWCDLHGTRSLAPTDDGVALAAGGVLFVVGQLLNGLVFYRLGGIGVFFGDRLGYDTGDWVESCSALAEREDGTLTLLAFAERARAATARRGGSG